MCVVARYVCGLTTPSTYRTTFNPVARLSLQDEANPENRFQGGGEAYKVAILDFLFLFFKCTLQTW